MNERHRDERDTDAIEAALAHLTGGVRGIYARGVYLNRRRALMAGWAALLLRDAAPLAIEADAGTATARAA
jgi:hypothetical protein